MSGPMNPNPKSSPTSTANRRLPVATTGVCTISNRPATPAKMRYEAPTGAKASEQITPARIVAALAARRGTLEVTPPRYRFENGSGALCPSDRTPTHWLCALIRCLLGVRAPDTAHLWDRPEGADFAPLKLDFGYEISRRGSVGANSQAVRPVVD